jgi:hypothetical protein
LPRLTPGSPSSPQRSPVGPGVATLDQIDFTVDGILGMIAGDESKGRSLGALTAAPSFTASPEYLDRTESLVGLNAPFFGAQQLTRTDVTVEVEFAELTKDNMQAIHPGLDSEEFVSSLHGHLVVGTGNSAFALTAREPGTAGNSITITLVKAAAADAPTSVAVSAEDITVTLGTNSDPTPFTINATANEVIAAINASAPAKALVKAGRASGSDGTGTVAAAVEAPLAGGTTSTTRSGDKLTPRGFISNGDYFDNITMALEGQNQPLMQLYVVHNVISLDEISFSPADDGDISSMSATFTGHVTASQLDTELGVYRPPYDLYFFDVAASA